LGKHFDTFAEAATYARANPGDSIRRDASGGFYVGHEPPPQSIANQLKRSIAHELKRRAAPKSSSAANEAVPTGAGTVVDAVDRMLSKLCDLALRGTDSEVEHGFSHILADLEKSYHSDPGRFSPREIDAIDRAKKRVAGGASASWDSAFLGEFVQEEKKQQPSPQVATNASRGADARSHATASGSDCQIRVLCRRCGWEVPKDKFDRERRLCAKCVETETIDAERSAKRRKLAGGSCTQCGKPLPKSKLHEGRGICAGCDEQLSIEAKRTAMNEDRNRRRRSSAEFGTREDYKKLRRGRWGDSH
jgi:hypothetical protein